jgi:type I restriction enzyme S subunit
MRPYPAYKDSGVEWLGAVPEGWEILRLKQSIATCRNGIWGDDPETTDDPIICVRVADFDRQALAVRIDEPTLRAVTESERQSRLLHPGNLLLEKSGGGEGQPVGVVVLFKDEVPAVCSNFVARIELAKNMHPNFWLYAHRMLYDVRVNVRSIKQTSGIQNLDQSAYFDEIFAFPPLPEQQAIALFLDKEVAKIDALVAEQRRLIALLAEKRQAVISHTVTKGLNPATPLKPSGIDWLGDIPEGWEVVRLRRVLNRIEQGFSPECFAYPAEAGEWGVLKAGCVNRGIYAELENKALPPEIEPRPDAEVKVGDVLMSRASGSPELIGSVALVRTTQGRIMLSDKIFRLKLNNQVAPSFFAWVMGSTVVRAQIVNAISGGEGMANNLPQGEIKEFFIALPPVARQIEVAAYLDAQTAQFDALTTTAQSAISLLQERRAALISAAVTGKIDLRPHFAQSLSEPETA